jgi:SulP family sulfate permease
METVAQKRRISSGITRLDIAGAFGDIGVLFPIAIALITLNHMNPTAVFLVAGLAYVFAGIYFRIPIAVQPFKAVAAIALALALPPSAIASAGLWMGVIMLFIGTTNLVTPLARLFSLPIVRGIQLGLGLLLAREGLRLMFRSHSSLILAGGGTIPAWAIALSGAAVLLAFYRSRRFPAALVLLGAGMLLGWLASSNGPDRIGVGWGPLPLQFLHPQAAEFKRVLFALVVPQFALTFGNSIVATENTAKVLFGSQAQRVTARGLSLSIGLVNLASGMLISAPLCHGSGGITAHYKFGARSRKSTFVIGGTCILLALFGRAAVGLLNVIPVAVLGVFLTYVGVQHAALVQDIARRPASAFIAAGAGLVSLATTNLTWGFAVGFLLEGLFHLFAKLRAKAQPAPMKP